MCFTPKFTWLHKGSGSALVSLVQSQESAKSKSLQLLLSCLGSLHSYSLWIANTSHSQGAKHQFAGQALQYTYWGKYSIRYRIKVILEVVLLMLTWGISLKSKIFQHRHIMCFIILPSLCILDFILSLILITLLGKIIQNYTLLQRCQKRPRTVLHFEDFWQFLALFQI